MTALNAHLRDHPTGLGAVGSYHKTLGSTDSVGFFAVSGARLNPTRATDPTDFWVRCDSNSYGPYGYHRWDAENEICNCGRTDQPDESMGHHELVLANISFVSAVIEALPHGYILYFELHDPALDEICLTERHSDCARTLQELFRLMLEWKFAHEHCGNNELVAISCAGMVDALEIPEDIQDWLIATVPPEKVGKFIAGDPLAQQRNDIADIPDLSDEFDQWLCAKILATRPIGSYR